MAIPLPIETERLLIRPFDVDKDTAAAARVYRDPEVMRYIPGGELEADAAVRAMLQKYQREQAERGFTFWAVVDRRDGEVIGDAGFGIFEQTADVELGYTFARDRWGQGLATEAAGACLAAGLAHLDAARIVAVIDGENRSSMRVAERIGMELVERIDAFGRPHVLYAAVR